MLPFLAAFAATALLTLLILRSGRAYGRLAGDHDVASPQKFHLRTTPRVGGLAILGGLALVMSALWWIHRTEVGKLAVLLIGCSLPAFAAGLLEDLTKRIGPAPRMVAIAVSALLAVLLIGASIRRTDLWGLDWIASFTVGAALLAVFAVTGVVNAVNIIDGFNGLASMCVVMMLFALTYVAAQVGDVTIMTLALIGAGAVCGFFIWNYPAGLIFLGDGGAYLLGFYFAELGILLLQRNPGVSPLCPLLMCIYPIFETLFSMYRKRVLRGTSPGLPDGVHLHMLVYKRLLRWGLGKQTAKEMTRRNSMTSPYLWSLCMVAVVPSMLFWDNTAVLGGFIVLFGVMYVTLYWRIVRFKTPDWLILHRRPR